MLKLKLLQQIIPSFVVGINLLLIMSKFVESIEIVEYYPEERDALLQLRDSVTSLNADLHSNWTGPPYINSDSKWVGIACSDGHVVQVVLEGVELTGYLPSTFPLNVTFLTKLSFRDNRLSGPLPNLTNLVHLEHVLLSRKSELALGFNPFGVR